MPDLNVVIQKYVSEIDNQYATGRAREHSYRPALKELLESVSDKITATNEPAREVCGAPDFIITDRKNIPRGFIEAKDIILGILDRKENQEQIRRYFDGGLGYNFIHTDNLEFRFYRDGECVQTVAIARMENGHIVPFPENFEVFWNLATNFLTFHGQTITSSRKLSEMMAGKARMIKTIVADILDRDTENHGELSSQYDTFRRVLMHDMTIQQFADMYAQTITYGLFAARLHDPTLPTFDRDEAARLLPPSNPFLQKFFQHLRDSIDDRIAWIVDDLVTLFRATDVRKLLQSYGKTTRRHDPVIHFYEDFLAAYDPQLRKSRGVWYTPEPVVDFIVRGVDDILKQEFDIADGLASTEKITIRTRTQNQDARTKTGVKMADKDIHRVQILDPATGTGTFLARVITQIREYYDNMPATWDGYVAEHLIPRLHGFEILMASYAMAHLKLDMLLKETGFSGALSKRLGVYLTNSLEAGQEDVDTLFSHWLAEEANDASVIKTRTPVMVVVGNPPYSGVSSNNSAFAQTLVEKYKIEPGGKEKLKERKHWLNDDYVKFISLAEDHIERTGEGIVGFVTNHSYLDNQTFRGMRWHLLSTFDEIYVLDLHGNAKKKESGPDGAKDENVFDIQQGVSIIFGVKTGKKEKGALATVRHAELWGKREEKYASLGSASIASVGWKELPNKPPYYFFVPKDFTSESDYQKGFSVAELFKENVTGIVTMGDSFAVADSRAELRQRLQELQSAPPTEEVFKRKWSLGKNYAKWLLDNIGQIEIDDAKFVPIDYRPFDQKWTYFDNRVIWRWREKVMRHFLAGENMGMIVGRQATDVLWSNVQVAENIIDNRFHFSAKGISSIFPLYLYPKRSDQQTLHDAHTHSRVPNFDPEIIGRFEQSVGLTLGSDMTPEDVFDYAYVVLHSPSYRETYKEFLKIDFPRVPYPTDREKFRTLVDLGRTLRELHLMRAPLLDDARGIRFDGGSDTIVTVPRFVAGDSGSGRVYINETVYFEGVTEVAWNFFVGGYQPAQKWLKDRKGRTLSIDDVRHYTRIASALAHTYRVMQEIDTIGV